MTKFMQKSFSVPVGDSEAYRANYDAVFARKGKRADDAVAKPLAGAAEDLLQEAAHYVKAAIRVPDGEAERLYKRIQAFLEGK